ncbi:MAG: hypothetical protein M1833_004084 [Piccolia ochrophora]|nr:MAG: hypothetical protein M1833_004084 [Piccolia ochrophora]
MSQPPPGVIEYQLDHIHEDRRNGLAAYLVVGLVLSGIAVVLRFIARRISKAELKADDWFMVAGLVFVAGFTANSLVMIYDTGLGLHSVAANLPKFARVMLPHNVIFSFAPISIKISILLLYRRIFIYRTFRWVVWGLVVFFVAAFLINLFLSIFQCVPVQKAWKPELPGHCLGFYEAWYAGSALLLATDVMLLIVPIPVVWQLQMDAKQKLGLIAVFLLGSLACFTKGIQFATFKSGVDMYDIPYTIVATWYWAGAELYLGIICGCLVTCMPLIRRRKQNSGAAGKEEFHREDRVWPGAEQRPEARQWRGAQPRPEANDSAGAGNMGGATPRLSGHPRSDKRQSFRDSLVVFMA